MFTNSSIANAQQTDTSLRSAVIVIDNGGFPGNAAEEKKFRELIGNARVVMLGEISHGEGNVFRIKADLVKYLHERMGFNVLAFESGLIDVAMANEAIKEGEDVNEAMSNSLFNVWTGSEDFRGVLRYVHQNKNTLQIAGFDHQITGTYAIRFWEDDLPALLRQHNKDTAGIGFDMLGEVSDFFGERFSWPRHVDFKQYRQMLTKLLSALENINDNNETTRRRKNLYAQFIRSTLSLATDYFYHNPTGKNINTFKASDSNARDAQMANNLLFLLKYFKDQKIICWGASLHFANRTDVFNDSELNDYKPMGQLVKNSMGDTAVINVAVTGSYGTYATWSGIPKELPRTIATSVESVLMGQGYNTCLVDLKKNSVNTASFTSYAFDHLPLQGPWEKAFDALLYTREITPSRPRQEDVIDTAFGKNDPGNQISVDTAAASLLKIKVVDGKSGIPVPFATIRVTRTGEANFTSETGLAACRFACDPKDTIIISSIGYNTFKTTVEKLSIVHTVSLMPGYYNLGEVVVSQRKINAEKVLKAAVKAMSGNFIQDDMMMDVYVHMLASLNDSVVSDQEYIADMMAKNGYSSKSRYKSTVRKANIIQADRSGGKYFVPFQGTSIWSNMLDAVKSCPVLNAHKINRLRVSLDSIIYTDSSRIIVVGITAKRANAALVGIHYVSDFYGTIYIQESDMAILKTDMTWNRDTGRLNQLSEEFSARGRNVPIGNTILHDEAIRTVNIYQRKEDGRYSLHYGHMYWNYKGFNLKLQRDIRLNAHMLLFVNSVQTTDVKSTGLPARMENLYRAAADKDFWYHYNRPLIR
ncbi:erythromycin esterase family protein [Chitinophaga flava]|nr:erythromycin esterase family protein [Chitinophaga flava]